MRSFLSLFFQLYAAGGKARTDKTPLNVDEPDKYYPNGEDILVDEVTRGLEMELKKVLKMGHQKLNRIGSVPNHGPGLLCERKILHH